MIILKQEQAGVGFPISSGEPPGFVFQGMGKGFTDRFVGLLTSKRAVGAHSQEVDGVHTSLAEAWASKPPSTERKASLSF